MKEHLILILSLVLTACSWGPKTVNTQVYKISDITPPESIEELRVYSQMSDKCPGDYLKKEAVVPLGALLLGSAVKQIAAYGKDQVDIAIKYLQGDVKLSGKSFLPSANMAPSSPTARPLKLCVMAVYGMYGRSDLAASYDNFKAMFSLIPESRIDVAFMDKIKSYRISGDKSPNPLEGIIGNPVYILEVSAVVIAGGSPAETKFTYDVTPTFMWYPHALHKRVFDNAKRALTVELGFSDVQAILPLDGLQAGHFYTGDDFAAKFSLIEGLKTTTTNVVTISVTEGPDKIPSDKVLSVINDGIKAKADELSKKIDDKYAEQK
jgi:hypothetical protein